MAADPQEAPASPGGGLQTLRAMLLAVLVALSIRCFFCEVFQIPSGSMIPTLQVGDRILVNKLVYGPRIPFTGRRLWTFSPAKRGEVAVFLSPDRTRNSDDYIKRIIGLPGDTVEVRRGVVYINGGPLPRIPLGQVTSTDRDARSGVWLPVVADAYLENFDPAVPSRGGATAPLDGGFTVLKDRSQPVSAHDSAPQVVPPGHVFAMGDNRDHSEDSRVWGFVPAGALLGRASVILFTWGEHGPSFARSLQSLREPARLR